MSRSQGINEIEDFPKRLKIFFVVISILLIFGTTGFSLIDNTPLKSSFFRTLQTLSFIFEEEPVIAERLLEIFLAIVGVFLVWWVLWSIADMILDGNLRKYLKTRFYSYKIGKMKNHIIVVGGGRIGEEISRVLYLKKKSCLIIESDPHVVVSLKKKGYTVIEGDALKEEILKKANIEKSSKIIITLPKTESNILITLSVKELNPKIEVYSRCEKSSLVSKLKKVGAKVVIVPEIVAADKIAEDLGV
ncbi:MAG: NAD-binding protein [Nanoarchaeota archaeon]|nr:NAD-binding protein [Nanoarchaeota archaeon]